MMNGQETSSLRRKLDPAHFNFKVHSYSKLFKELDDRYQSGVFEAGGYKWRLIFYPHGNKQTDARGHISLYLAIDDSDSHSDISVNFKCFVLDQNEQRFFGMQEANGIVRKFNHRKKEWGYDRFLSNKTFMDPSYGFLKDDSCVFGAEVFVIEPSDDNETLSMVRCEGPENTHQWKIHDYRQLPRGKNYCTPEPFNFEERKWKLVIHPMGNGSGVSKYLALYLKLDPEDSPQQNSKMYAKFKLRVQNLGKNTSVEKQLAHWYSTDQSQQGSNEFMPLSEVYDPDSGYLLGDTLNVEVEFLVVSQVDN